MNPLPLLLSILVLVFSQLPARAFDARAHHVTGILAFELLSPQAKEKVLEILRNTGTFQRRLKADGTVDGGRTLGAAAVWPDQERGRERRAGSSDTGPYHYVNVHIDTQVGYDDSLSDPKDPNKGGIVEMLRQYYDVLGDESAEREKRQMALFWVAHLVGDVHQPLHVGQRNDRGGNAVAVRLVKRNTNLHAAWDGGIAYYGFPAGRRTADKSDSDPLLLAVRERMTTRDQGLWTVIPEGGIHLCFHDWANESFKIAKEGPVYYFPATEGQPRREIVSGMFLSIQYVEGTKDVVVTRLAQASARLAFVLESALGE